MGALIDKTQKNYIVDSFAEIIGELKERLHRWTRAGQYGFVFDNVQDTLTFSRFQTFNFHGWNDAPAVLEPLLAQLSSLLSTTASVQPSRGTTPAATDPAQSRAAAAQLKKLLVEFDPSAADFVDENRSALRPLFPDADWAEFETLVQSYSFAEAQARLERALMSPSML